MLAIKENKVYSITTDEEAKAYRSQGFDIYDNNGKIKEYGSGKTVPLDSFKQLESENKKLKAEIAKLKKQDEK